MRSVPDPLPPFPDAYARFFPPIRAKCRRLLGSNAEAEEIAQEAFVRLWQMGPSGPAHGPGADVRAVMAWLYRTCTRLAIDVLRRRRLRQDQEPATEDCFPCAIALADSVEARSAIFALRARVPGDELEAAILCRVDGLSHAEAAEVLEISERTLRRLLERFDARAERWKKEFRS
jgi:RNA polymerase sigma-70 factor, ECF subfamily